MAREIGESKMSNTNEQAAMRKAFKKYCAELKKKNRNLSYIWESTYEAGWNAANQHARETEQGEVCVDCGFTLEYPNPDDPPVCYRCDAQEWESMYRKLEKLVNSDGKEIL